jgi:YgiT-type zinc finger domain-containing protein
LASGPEDTQEVSEEETMRKRCSNECQGVPETGRVTQRFERRGSPVTVIIHNIPATICPKCDEAYLAKETARQVDLLLEPFHGKHDRIPSLPPAIVNIDFVEAISAMKAA